MVFPQVRMRRLRQNASLRSLLQETKLSHNDLVAPVFIKEGRDIRKGISSLPGHFQLSPDNLPDEVRLLWSMGIQAVILFGIPNEKDHLGSHAMREDAIVCQAIEIIKDATPDMLVIADLCFCEYTEHGHCGVIHHKTGTVDNDKTLENLGVQALQLVKAGCDMVAPSGMMDGMIQSLRKTLDEHQFEHIPLMSYAAKYSSSYYESFREAAESEPSFGDRLSYQMNPANSREALREVSLDIQEGADIIMVKPAQTYLDLIYRVKLEYPHIPLAAYHVSGEFAAICAAAERGWLDKNKTALEVLTSIKRAGADFIINYFSKDITEYL